MAVSALNTTTLSEALTAETGEFAVGSTANIVVGSLLVVAGKGGFEVMRVQEIPVSGRVKAMRGVGGSRARKHPSGALLYIGDADDFKNIRQNAAALIGDSGNLPDYCLPGTRARDGAGNEYVMVDLTFSGYDGAAVLISRDGNFTASALASGQAGSVGILAEEGTSDQLVWAQIYGYKSYAQFTSGSSLATSTGVVQPATTSSTPAGGLLGRTTSQASSEATARVFGLYLASAVTTATTAATSATGFQAAVWLNYPFVERAISS